MGNSGSDPLGRLLVAATAAVAVAAGAAAGSLLLDPTGVAHGEPSCANPAALTTTPGSGTGVERECREVNQLVSGREHEDRVYWTRLAGAEFPQTTVREDSFTPYEADLFAVRFRNARQGFAGGAVCSEPVDPAEVESCDRVPVIYGTDDETPWHEAYRAEGPGYVGAIAWIGRGRALAVGGTGTYPRREPNRPGGEWNHDARVEHDRDAGAGDARAWYFHGGEWEDISEELPEEMRGLSTLDLWIGREQDGDEWGLAGAYGQIWEWEGGRFTGEHIDKDSPGIGPEDGEWSIVDGPVSYSPQQVTDPITGEQRTQWNPSAEESHPELFQFRLREIRIAPDRTQKRVIAFTSGCCGLDQNGDGVSDEGGSRRIEFRPLPKKNEAGIPPDQNPPARPARPHWVVSSTNTYGESVYSFAFRQTRFFNGFGGPDEFGESQPEHAAAVWNLGTTVVARAEPGRAEASAGPTAPPEPRYVASDADTEPGTFNGNMPVTGNGVPDWKVGQAPPSDPQLRGLGVLATTLDSLKPAYGGIQPPCSFPPRSGGVGDWTSVGGEVLIAWQGLIPGAGGGNVSDGPPGFEPGRDTWVCRLEQINASKFPSIHPDGPLRTRESGVQLGPTWALNAVDIVEADGVGYAVGDRGAILRMGVPPAETEPPPLGARRPAPLADRTPYADRTPAPAPEVGEVAPLATQPREQLDDPRMVRAGSPHGNEIGSDQPVEDIGVIVMSRDGSEGWGIGPSPEAQGGSPQPGLGVSAFATRGVMTLYDYAAGQWTRCDPVGSDGAPPDPACAGIRDLYQREISPNVRVRLNVAARIPLEYDDDPSNDDEFEVLAIGTSVAGPGGSNIPVQLRYREGKWRLEDPSIANTLAAIFVSNASLRPASLACIGPDECWLVSRAQFGASSAELHRFDGERWIGCGKPNGAGATAPVPNRVDCGDAENRLGSIDWKTEFAQLSVASAGERVYFAASRVPLKTPASIPAATGLAANSGAAVILYKDHGPGESWRADGGGYDPGFNEPEAPGGRVSSVAVAQRPDGSFEGWAVGQFGLPKGSVSAANGLFGWPLMRLDPATGEWRVHRVRDAVFQILGSLRGAANGSTSARQVTLPGSGDEPGVAYIGTYNSSGGLPSELLTFNPRRDRWEGAERPDLTDLHFHSPGAARVQTVAPDNRGGIWAAFATDAYLHLVGGGAETYLYNYTRTPRREVFEEAPNPLAASERLTDLAGSADGSLWATSDNGVMYRYERVTGWERVEVPGFDPGRVVTRRSRLEAVALGPDGSGLAVGERGKIAAVSPGSVALDPAAGIVCDEEEPSGACGTSFNLRSVAVAGDGSGAALVGGESMALLWRPGGGDLRKIEGPDAPPFATVTGIAMPTADRAWLVLDTGQVYAGTGGSSGAWRWKLENVIDVSGQDRFLNEDKRGDPIALRDIAVDSGGHGYAVGDRGMVLERSDDREQPWRRVDAGVTEKLTSVAVPAGRGSGGLIGGDRGLLLTFSGGEWRLARAGDQLRPDNGYVAGVALLPGIEAGQVEAWAGVTPYRLDRRTGAVQLLHHSNAPDEPLLDPVRRAAALPDAPEPREGELSFAALGRSDCPYLRTSNEFPCIAYRNSTDPEQLIQRRIREELASRAGEPGAPEFAVFTGDPYDTPGNTAMHPVEDNSDLAAFGIEFATSFAALGLPGLRGGVQKYARFNEQLTDWLSDRGVPVFGAVGSRDLSETRACFTTTVSLHCVENRDRPRAGDNITWRQAMEGQPSPWGNGEPARSPNLVFEPLSDSGQTIRPEDVEVDDPTDQHEPIDDPGDSVPATGLPPDPVPPQSGTLDETVNSNTPDRVGGQEDLGDIEPSERAGDLEVHSGGASTHYAADIVRDGERVARLIVVDTSFGSLAASDPAQHPLEADGGQRAWLERVLCIRGSAADAGQCSRDPGQQAIVVSSTPTYSYGPTTPAETQADGALFESILLRHRANVVVSGRLGWNGRYWALAPGLHEPCPRGAYVPDHQAPAAGTPRVCGNDLGTDAPGPGEILGQAGGLLDSVGGTGALPFVVASGAGGRFDEFAEGAGQDTSENGFWRGYSIVRLPPSGDPRETIVEQRPILDWVEIAGTGHVLRPGQRLTLRGRGREPIAGGSYGDGRFDELTSPAVTHRFELLEAVPERPWVPRQDQGSSDDGDEVRSPASERMREEDPCGPYLCLDPRVGGIDDQTGRVRSGNGQYPRTYAIAQLSVGERVATYPLVFEPRSSFRTPAPVPPRPSLPPPPSAPSQPPVPNAPSVEAPPPPATPLIESPLSINPVIPPTPPSYGNANPIDLGVAPVAIVAPPPTVVLQPPNPVVQPAPPSGARREARQRQAATQKSGADGDASQQASDAAGDLAESPGSPHGSEMTRHDFTAIARQEPVSAWARDAMIGGGLGIAALVLALGLSGARPTPRRRPPEEPAPAWSRLRR